MRCYLCCRYHYNPNPLLPKIKARLKFADGAAIKRELDTQIKSILGPKTESDLVKPDKKAKKKVSFIGKLGLILGLRETDPVSAAVRARLHNIGAGGRHS